MKFILATTRPETNIVKNLKDSLTSLANTRKEVLFKLNLTDTYRHPIFFWISAPFRKATFCCSTILGRASGPNDSGLPCKSKRRNNRKRRNHKIAKNLQK